jgi:DNA-binding transcriptional regulator YdaS (Cro superfamily)
MDTSNPFDLAVSRVGGRRALASAMGVSVQALVRWRRRIPAERVIGLEALSGVSREVLRPDLYAPAAPVAAEAAPINDARSLGDFEYREDLERIYGAADPVVGGSGSPTSGCASPVEDSGPVPGTLPGQAAS